MVSLRTNSGAFSACLPARGLSDFVKPDNRADHGSVLELKAVENGQVVVAYEGAMTTLPSLPVEDFPRGKGAAYHAGQWQRQVAWDAAGWPVLTTADEQRADAG